MTQRQRRVALGIHALGWMVLLAAASLARAGLGTWWMAPAVACFAVTLAHSLYQLALGLDIVERPGEEPCLTAVAGPDHRGRRNDRGSSSPPNRSRWGIGDLYGSTSAHPSDERRLGCERSRSVRGGVRTVAGSSGLTILA